ncbi:MAG: RNA polymerase sigma factor FliA [Psychromonas sp.]|nr:RNA polymerase sigma factor FliA [Psychromonas sp.]
MFKAKGYFIHPTQLIELHSDLVRKIAFHLLARLPPSVEVDDLIQSGMIGLLESAKKYDSSKGASFETYAGIRIRGAMLDDLRKGDWVPRSVHKNSRMISATIATIEKKTGKNATATEIAGELEVSIGEYQKMLRDVRCATIIPYEDLPTLESGMSNLGSSDDVVFHSVSANQFSSKLSDIIKELPEKETLVLSLYYDEELNLKEIGSVLGVSESRVSQIHSQALHRLKSKSKMV